MHVLKTANAKDPVNVFVQFKALPDWQETILQHKPTWLADLAGWSALDLDVNANDINLTGISLVPDSASTYLGLFNDAGSQSVQFEHIVPENAALVVNQSCGDMKRWGAALDTYLGVHNRLKKRNALLEEYAVQPKTWHEIITGEMGIFYVDAALPIDESKQGYIRVNDAEEAMPLLQTVSSPEAETYRDHAIYKFEKRNVLQLLFGQLYSNMPQPYWFIHNDWVVFSNNLDLAKNHINNLLAEKSWSNSTAFGNAESLLDGDAHIIVLARNPEWLSLALKEVKEPIDEKLKKQKEDLAAINWMLVQFKQRNEAAYTEVVFLHQTKQEGTAKQYWSTSLGSAVLTRPRLVRNHYSNANEVIVQDEAHNLYLLDPKGEILWKKPIDGPILGQVEQIDMYKNNKLQLVFTTADKLYIIDRNGRDVAPFPVNLPAKATAPLGIFDYANNRDYRLVVPCGKRLVNYGIDGRPVRGWNFSPAKADLVTQPKHEVIGNKDYIHVADAQGNLLVLNRRGEVRVPTTKKMRNLASGISLIGKNQSEARFFALSKSGYQLSLYMNDNLDSIQPFGNKPRYVQLLGDRMLFGGGNELYFRSPAANFDIMLEDDLTTAPAMFIAGGKLFITATTGESVWVYDEKGELLPGMPLYGSGTATVGRTQGNDLHVIVASPDGVVADYKLSPQ